jgi:hypothetical protein
MDAVYGVKSWEESFTGQLSYLPAGPLGVFGTVEPTDKATPPGLQTLWKRFEKGEIDADEFKDEARVLKRQQTVVSFVGP